MIEALPEQITGLHYAIGGSALGAFSFWLWVRKQLRADKAEAVVNTAYVEIVNELRAETVRLRAEVVRSTEEVKLLRDESTKLRDTVVKLEVTVSACKQERQELTARVEAFELKYGERRGDKPS